MAQMLKHKETGELFIYTDAYAKLPELELVVEDPVAKVIAEVAAQNMDEELNKALEIPTFGKQAVNTKKHGK